MNTYALVPAFLCVLAVSAPARADAPELINEVEAASVSLTAPHTVTVCARGTVTTGGWTGARITPARRIGHAGVYDLDFTAVKPRGLATQMISPISAKFVWAGAPADLKGVRVRGLRGSAIAMLGGDGAC